MFCLLVLTSLTVPRLPLLLTVIGQSKLNYTLLLFLTEPVQLQQPQEHLHWNNVVRAQESSHLAIGRIVELLLDKVDLHNIEQQRVELDDGEIFRNHLYSLV